MTPSNISIAYGKCECGCGRDTWVATVTNRKLGYVKGRPVRFIKGHQRVKKRPLPYIDGNIVRIPLPDGREAIASPEDFPFIAGKYFSTDGRYVVVNHEGRLQKLHKLLVKAPRGKQIDHVNRDRLDNRRENFRFCTQHQNCGNKPLSKNNTTGFKGVSRFGDRFRVYVRHKGIVHYGGIHEDIRDAAISFNTIAKKLWGAFAYQNEVD